MNPRQAMILAALLLLAGCLSPERQLTTVWPPDDFFFEVRHSVITDDGLQERQQVQFHRDGLVFFREASTFIDAAGDEPPLPVFGRACRYQVRKDSLRQLSRLLSRAGLFELSAALNSEPGSAPDLLTVRWRAFGDVRGVLLQGKVYGQAMRVLRITNAFLPRGHEFILTEMTGETEEPHLLAVPEPSTDPAAALAHHEAMLARAPLDQGLLAETFVLAHVVGRNERAGELLQRLEELEAADRSVQQMFPQEGGGSVAVRLRRLLR